MHNKHNLIAQSYGDTPYHDLMRKRIHKVLLLCSRYDAFYLEDDGRIDEKIFNEYTSLNLSQPPEFIVQTDVEASYNRIKSDNINLVIIMYDMGDIDPFELATTIKNENPELPIVVLTPFSREVNLFIHQTHKTVIDYIFSWLGNADLLLAIIKLIEDKMNAEHDILEIGVQGILLVEDSVRFYSSYLPNLYKIIFQQSKEFMKEGLNVHQQMMKMRGRPKILLATTFEEAVELYDKYKSNLLGVITDITYEINDVKNHTAGFKLCKQIKADDPFMPVVIQSSESENRTRAEEIGAGFIDKNSTTLLQELRDYVRLYFAFGDFVFMDPITNTCIGRAENLKELQEYVLTIPDRTLEYHISGNNFSKWLYARAIFSVARMFKTIRPEDFSSLGEVRQFIYDSITYYRIHKTRGIIASFNKNHFDEFFNFARIGDASIGGKGRGLAFIDSMVMRNQWVNKWEDVIVSIPRTVVLSIDIFDEFIDTNNLLEFAINEQSDENILNRFVTSSFSQKTKEDLRAFLEVVNKPIAIRSSSMLEDSHYQPFAGVYSTYMIPLLADKEKMLLELEIAIKSVFASVYFRNSKMYMTATSNVIDEEKMAVVLQELCGTQYESRFYPTLSGVARSINFYPIAPEKPSDGIVNLAFGLGKYIVEGGQTLRFSPAYPHKILQLSSPEMTLKETQKTFYALNMDSNAFYADTNDSMNILNSPIEDATADNTLKWLTSTYDFQTQSILDGTMHKGKMLLTFSGILKYDKFPMAEIIKEILEISQKEMNKPVEIEFAVDISQSSEKKSVFSLLQIRPIVENKEIINEDLTQIPKDELLISSNMSLGNGIIDDICDIIYVKHEQFDPSKNDQLVEMIDNLNQQMLKEKRNYILIGPGRWGSSDSWLGIPVKWSQISGTRLIIEMSLEKYMIDPSQGTHFFQNLTSFRVGYFTINQPHNQGSIAWDIINQLPVVFENDFVCHVRSKLPLTIMLDAMNGNGVVKF